jgi:hypothetical protein
MGTKDCFVYFRIYDPRSTERNLRHAWIIFGKQTRL